MSSEKQGARSTQGVGRVCLLVLSFGFLVAGCSTTPSTSIHQPMTAKPVEKRVVAPPDGAIFHAGINERPLFEDKRARNVGDILTINIVEKTSGNRKTSGS
ncbi:MAG: flagellar basal body L-ring protein FlgH, partial [Gallionella sp.]|nr:flagellar basal body L-ring protein FlgH [Gallionella sp.]